MLQIYPDWKPFFSVIICTYNRAYILHRALDSLLKQTYKNFEVLIIDDGSTDSTNELIKKYNSSDLHLRYVYHKNRGLPLSRNVGILASGGKFITFLDSDDEYLPNHLEIHKNIICKIPGTDFIYGNVKVIGNPYVPDMHDINKLVNIDDCKVGGSFFIRKELAISLNGFKNLEYADDSEFFSRVAESNANIFKCENRTYIYHRELKDSMTFNYQKNNEKI
jgi:glycosyltransferase involved in cell wall biosynthesis